MFLAFNSENHHESYSTTAQNFHGSNRGRIDSLAGVGDRRSAFGVDCFGFERQYESHKAHPPPFNTFLRFSVRDLNLNLAAIFALLPQRYFSDEYLRNS